MVSSQCLCLCRHIYAHLSESLSEGQAILDAFGSGVLLNMYLYFQVLSPSAEP